MVWGRSRGQIQPPEQGLMQACCSIPSPETVFSRENDKKPVKKTGTMSRERKKRSRGTQPAGTAPESPWISQPSSTEGAGAAAADPGVGEGVACCCEPPQPPRTSETCGDHATGPEALLCPGNVPATCGQVSWSRAEPPWHQQCHEHSEADNEDVPPRVNVRVLEVGDPRAHGHGVGDTEHPPCEGQESSSARQAAGTAVQGKGRVPTVNRQRDASEEPCQPRGHAQHHTCQRAYLHRGARASLAERRTGK